MYISIQNLKLNINDLKINISDIEDEINSINEQIENLNSLLTKCNAQLVILKTKIEEKKNVYNDCINMLNNRIEIIKQDRLIFNKCQYVQQCQQHIIFYSNQQYVFEDFTNDEIIEYSHKLHFCKIYRDWIDYNVEKSTLRIESSKFHVPFNEFDFENFEIKYGKDKDHIYLSDEVDCNYQINTVSYEKCNCDIYHVYVIEYTAWSSFIHFENEYHFSINSDFKIMDSLIDYIHIYKDDA